MTVRLFETDHATLDAAWSIVNELYPNTAGKHELPFPFFVVSVPAAPHDPAIEMVVIDLNSDWASTILSSRYDGVISREWVAEAQAHAAELLAEHNPDRLYFTAISQDGQTAEFFVVIKDNKWLQIRWGKRKELPPLPAKTNEERREFLAALTQQSLDFSQTFAFIFLFNLPRYFKHERLASSVKPRGIVGERTYAEVPDTTRISMTYEMRKIEKLRRKPDDASLVGLTDVRGHWHPMPRLRKGKYELDLVFLAPHLRRTKGEGYKPEKVHKVSYSVPT